MEVVMGIDPSSKLLARVTTFDGSNVEVEVRPLPSTKGIERRCAIAYLWLGKRVRQLKAEGHIVHVFIEQPVGGRGGAHATIVQSQVNGALLAAALIAGADSVVLVNNKRWKKVIIGNGNASKPMVTTWARECWRAVYDMAPGTQDVHDAAAIHQYGEKHVLRVIKRKTIVKKGEQA
jgi:Holliday junction resolvasome RuvABC endonuclease subunit